ATTDVRAASARRRRSSNQSGKYEPWRSLGIATSKVPTRVSKSRCRYPLRTLVRSGLDIPYGAPHTASASADINTSMNVYNNSRNRSGEADSSCSCRKRAGSILLGAVIGFSIESTRKVSRRITRWPPYTSTPRPSPSQTHTTLADATPWAAKRYVEARARGKTDSHATRSPHHVS